MGVGKEDGARPGRRARAPSSHGCRGTTEPSRGLDRLPKRQNPLRTSTTMIAFMVLRVPTRTVLCTVAHPGRGARPTRPAPDGGWAVHAPCLGAGLAVHLHHVGREVRVAAQQAAAHAVGVGRHAGRLEGADLGGVEAAADDNLHVLEALRVQSRAHSPHELRSHARGPELTHHRPNRRRPCSPPCPDGRPTGARPSARAHASDVPTQSLSKSTRATTFTSG